MLPPTQSIWKSATSFTAIRRRLTGKTFPLVFTRGGKEIEVQGRTMVIGE